MSNATTNQLINIPEDYILRTSTDLDSNITSASPDFITLSGFKAEELLGKKHNVVRHPDTPKQVFADMWATLKKGHPWRAMVKNSTKCGNYYWVLANASPTFEKGKITGYISVRRAATAQQIQEGEAAYQAIKANKMKLEGGHLVPTSTPWSQRLSLFNYLHASIGTKFLLAFLPTLLLGLVLAGLALKSNYQQKNAYDLASAQTELLTLGSELMHESQKERGMSAGYLGSKGENFAAELVQQRKLFDQKQSKLNQFLTTKPELVTPPLQASFTLIKQQLNDLTSARAQVDNLSINTAKAIGHYSQLNASFIEVNGILSRSLLDNDVSKMLYALQNLEQIKELAGIERAILSNAFAANRFNPGFYERFVELVGNQSTYSKNFLSYATPALISEFDKLQSHDVFQQTQSYRDVVYAKNLQGGFDQSAKAWFGVQTDKINLLNDLVIKLKHQIADVSHQKANSNAQDFYTVTFFVILALLLSIYIGLQVFVSVVGTLRKINHVVNEINESGQLSDRVNIKDTGDELTTIANAFDNMIGTMERSIFSVSEVMEQIAKGNFDHRVTDTLNGDMNTLKDGVNHAAISVKNTMQALEEVMAGLAKGDFSVRLDDRVPPALREEVNHTLLTMDDAINAMGSVMKKLSNGEVNQRITLQLQGSFKTLADSINASLTGLQSAINEINQVAQGLAQGDLTIQAPTQFGGELEELRTNINNSVQSLAETLIEIQQATNEVSQASNEVNDGTNSLNERTQQQAASLEETAASMEEMTSSVQNSATNAGQASHLALDVKNKAQKGAEVMKETIDAMNGIHQASQKIGDIVSLIDSIAFQTNLLALNAAVEAARAGDHGRGFAVVAAEVRNLAQKSADAANDIKKLINHTTEQISSGSSLVEASGRSLDEINQGIASVTNLVAEIASSAEDQSKGIQQVNIAISSIDNTTQQNAALVEETSANTQTLQENSDRMKQAVGRFKLQKSLR